MLKNFFILFVLVALLFSCSKKNSKQVIEDEPTEEEIVVAVYKEAVKALNTGDAFYAGKKFKEVEVMMPQSEWAAKAALMAAYSHYSRNAYTKAVFDLER